MTPPPNLQVVRAAAERLAKITSMNGTGRVVATIEEMYAPDTGQLTYDIADAANYILATIHAEHDQQIDEQWLREVWGAKEQDARSTGCRSGEWSIRGVTGYFVFLSSELIWHHAWHTTAIITTRHQFTQLAQSLGIQPACYPPPRGGVSDLEG